MATVVPYVPAPLEGQLNVGLELPAFLISQEDPEERVLCGTSQFFKS